VGDADRRDASPGDAPFAPARDVRHTPLDDAQALLTGALLVALGVSMFKSAGLLTGGTAGVAFLIHYASGWPFGLVFFAVNLPFYVLALRQMGLAFTLKTFAAIALVSAMSDLMPGVVTYATLQPAFAAVAGGCLIGVGLLALFRHHASLGGLNVLALHLQRTRGWPAGKVQMAIDCAILAASFAWVPPSRIALSVLGAVALNLVVAINHKPGRYLDV
jgi:uncharacterized membrane-anchored protein YitT (DUF2179 family)